MCLLSDQTILELVALGVLGVEPFDPALVQPASLDVRLGKELLWPTASSGRLMPGRISGYDNPSYINDSTKGASMSPGAFVLCSTLERIRIPANRQGQVEGQSSLGRIGLMTHITAGFIDPGWDGVLTLELKNVGGWEIGLYVGMKIGQISFTWLDKPALRPYGSPGLGSHYQGAVGAQGIVG